MTQTIATILSEGHDARNARNKAAQERRADQKKELARRNKQSPIRTDSFSNSDISKVVGEPGLITSDPNFVHNANAMRSLYIKKGRRGDIEIHKYPVVPGVAIEAWLRNFISHRVPGGLKLHSICTEYQFPLSATQDFYVPDGLEDLTMSSAMGTGTGEVVADFYKMDSRGEFFEVQTSKLQFSEPEELDVGYSHKSGIMFQVKPERVHAFSAGVHYRPSDVIGALVAASSGIFAEHAKNTVPNFNDTSKPIENFYVFSNRELVLGRGIYEFVDDYIKNIDHELFANATIEPQMVLDAKKREKTVYIASINVFFGEDKRPAYYLRSIIQEAPAAVVSRGLLDLPENKLKPGQEDLRDQPEYVI